MSKEIAELKKQIEELKAKDSKVCPHCGHCKECGRGGQIITYPVYPWYPQPYYPWQPSITWCDGTSAQTITTGNVSVSGDLNTTSLGQFSFTN